MPLDNASIPALKAMILSENKIKAQQALRCLTQSVYASIRHEEALETLIDLLYEKHHMRQALIEALTDIAQSDHAHHISALNALATVAQEENDPDALNALIDVAATGDREALTALDELAP